MIEELGFRKFTPKISWKTFFAARSNAFRLVVLSKLFFGEQSTWYVSVIAFFCKVTRVRFIRFQTYAFGHLLMEPDLFLKEKALKQAPRFFFIWILDSQKVANPTLLSLWQKRIRSISIPFIDLRSSPLDKLYHHPGIFYDIEKYITAINETGEFGRLQSDWGTRPPVVSITDELKQRGLQQLEAFGVPPGSWFICLHCRESGFHKYMPGQEYRNANIDTYAKAIDWVIEQGGWVFRLGDPSMRPLKERPGLIDYAHSSRKSDWFDIFLGSEARYTLGSCSGPSSMSATFGKPMAMPNSLPLSAVPFYCHAELGLATPKLLRSSQTGKLLTFEEIMSIDVGNFRWSELYEKEGLEIIDNDADDILAIVKELHQMSEGTFALSKEDQKRQNAVKSLFRRGHYGYLSECLFSPAFLNRHQDLLPNDTEDHA